MSAFLTAIALVGTQTPTPAAPPPTPPAPVPVPMLPPSPIMVPYPPAPPPGHRPQLLRGSFVDYFTPADYPADALPLGGSAYVGFSLAVGPDGRVADCIVTASSGVLSLDHVTCRVLRERARYRPAHDADGRPMAGRHGGGIIWEAPALAGDAARILIPAPPPPRVISPQRARANLNSYFSADDYPAAALRAREEGTVGVSLVIGPDGRISDCTVAASSGSISLDAATCPILQRRARYSPARNSIGEPVSGQDAGRITWRLPAE